MLLSNGSLLPTQVDTLADTTPIFADASYYANTSLPLLGMWAAYGALYRAQLWVGIVVRKLASGTSRLPLDVKRQVDDNSQVTEDGGLISLLDRPNERLSAFKLWTWTSSTYDIYGEAHWLKLRDARGRVRELHPVNPTNLIYRRDPDTGEGFWLYSLGTRGTLAMPPIPETDMVSFLSYNPDTLARGVSNLEQLRMTLLNEDAARRATGSWWANGARPALMLSSDMSISDKAHARLKAEIDSIHAGADNTGKTLILEEGMKPVPVQLTAEEMQYIQSRKLNREEVCAAYDIPPPVVHILDNATYSNITEQMRSMYRDTMAPRLAFLESVLMHQLVPDFDSSGEVFARFNMDEVMRGTFETRATAAKDLIGFGVMKPAEARPMFGLPVSGDPSGDLLYGNAALVPLGSSIRGAQEVDSEGNLIPTPLPGTTAGTNGTGQNLPPAKPVAQVPQKGRRYDVRSLMGRIGSKATEADARAALVDEHTKALTDFANRQADDLGTTPKPLSSYDEDLAALLLSLSTVTSKTLGERIAKALGGAFDGSPLADWLASEAADSASNINSTTEADFAAHMEAADDPSAAAEAFRLALVARAGQIAVTRVTSIGGFSERVAAEQSGAASKTWIAGPNPRASHAALDGETVGLDEAFSNGMNGPGDPAGGADEVAGCDCSLDFAMA